MRSAWSPRRFEIPGRENIHSPGPVRERRDPSIPSTPSMDGTAPCLVQPGTHVKRKIPEKHLDTVVPLRYHVYLVP